MCQRVEFQHICNGNLNTLENQRLYHEIRRAKPDGLRNAMHVIAMHQHDNRHRHPGRAHPRQNGEAVHIRHGEVQQHQHDILALAYEAQRTYPAIGKDRAITHAHDYCFEIASLNRIVIRYENARCHKLLLSTVDVAAP